MPLFQGLERVIFAYSRAAEEKPSFGLSHTCKHTVRSRATSFASLGLSFLISTNEEMLQRRQEETPSSSHTLGNTHRHYFLSPGENCHPKKKWRKFCSKKVSDSQGSVRSSGPVSALLPLDMTVSGEKRHVSLHPSVQRARTSVHRVSRLSLPDNLWSPANA